MPYKIKPEKVYIVVFLILGGGALVKFGVERAYSSLITDPAQTIALKQAVEELKAPAGFTNPDAALTLT